MTGRLGTVGRLGIDDVRPRVSSGEVPAKAVVGEVIPLSAVVWREGHDAVSATAIVKGPTSASGPSAVQRIPMVPAHGDPDLVNAIFVPDCPGTWTFRIDAWSDPYRTWRHAIEAKVEAGQSAEEVANDLEIGARIMEDTANNVASVTDRPHLLSVAASLRSDRDIRARIAPALSAETTSIFRRTPLRELLTRGRTYEVYVERRRALVGSWYEFFPRSTGGVENGEPVHGTFATAAESLDRIARMNFDVVYLPPIHPIGHINRKGKNNTLDPTPDDVGSPWAIGSSEGGHDAVHPDLGTLDDFDGFVARARDLNLEVALDFALQCAPDHPWAAPHPEWFTVLPDGTIAYAENPPKKYQDIYPLNFDNDPEGLFAEIHRVLVFWIKRGVHIFRVDNPHTKPTAFWARLISTIHQTYPDIVFLAEAFTRRPILYGLAKAGFSQSYTYFTWQTSKKELEAFAEEIRDATDACRPNLFVNTPDILHASLQHGGKAMFAIRAALATTLSPSWGMYSGFEIYEHVAVKEGSEEYLDSEKYQLRPRDFEGARLRGESLEPFVTVLNTIRKEQPALQQLRTLRLVPSDNNKIMAYTKVDPLTGNALAIVVNLDSENVQETTIHLGLESLGLPSTVEVHDLITDQQWTWGEDNYVRLDPTFNVCHIVKLPEIPTGYRDRSGFAPHHEYRYTC